MNSVPLKETRHGKAQKWSKVPENEALGEETVLAHLKSFSQPTQHEKEKNYKQLFFH